WWLNLRPTSLAVDSLDMVFSHMVPSGKADITKWRESWLEQLSQLDSAMASILLDDPKMDANTVIPRRVLLDSPALAWFVKRFDMQIVDIINTDFDQQPSPERIDEIVKKSKEKYVSIIICTSGYRTPAVDEIAKQLSIEIWDEGTKARMTVPVPVVEVPIGLGGGGQSTEDFIPLHLFVAQTVARAYKPIIDGLFRLKQEIEKQQKATTDAPADGEAEGEGEAAPPAEGTPPPAEGAPPPAGGTPPTAGGQ
ncbi:MAG TPA: zinc ABC transporter substrate-binding protein, partial [bacterium]|nr:zinc ABC transporter substrate-binding protein [bacterium]